MPGSADARQTRAPAPAAHARISVHIVADALSWPVPNTDRGVTDRPWLKMPLRIARCPTSGCVPVRSGEGSLCREGDSADSQQRECYLLLSAPQLENSPPTGSLHRTAPCPATLALIGDCQRSSRVGAIMVTTLVLVLNTLSLGAIGVRIPSGTRVPVKLLQFVSSETSRVGDPVRFVVAQDVVVNTLVVIRRGTPASGTVVEATAYYIRRWLWWNHVHPGRLTFDVTATTAVDGEPIRLRLASGAGRGATPVIRWEHEGALFDAEVEGDYFIPPQ